MPLTQPGLQAVPFARDGLKNTLPVEPASGNQASMKAGFPAVTMQPVASGGLPPQGKDFNAILYQLSSHQVWMNAGGMYKFNVDLCTAIGGYPKGAVLQTDDGLSAYISTINGNSNNPNTTNPTGWKPFGGKVIEDKINTLQTKVDEVVDLVYPVGTVYVSTVAGFDPHDQWPGTTWVLQGPGKTPVGLSTDPDAPVWTQTVGNTFGNYEHQLTVDELPNFKPDIRLAHENGGTQDEVGFPAVNGSGYATHLGTNPDLTVTDKLGNGHPLGSVGGDQPHNIVQPSIVEARWKRTA